MLIPINVSFGTVSFGISMATFIGIIHGIIHVSFGTVSFGVL